MNISASWDGFLEVAFYLIIFGFFWRTLQAALSESSIGKAMSYIY
jgi:hypothetical protein